jgi:hypothetical protein
MQFLFMLSLFIGGLDFSRAGRSGLRIPVGVRDFSLLQNVRTVFGAHPFSYSVNTGVFPRIERPERDVIITHINTVPRLRVSGVIHRLPPVCLHGMNRENFTFYPDFSLRYNYFIWCSANTFRVRNDSWPN